ncbi:MAG: membrane-bound lytic murein transglycosylase MltF [Gammaproteobacteria bacterium]|nr:membrane-bound lytic murein transglycosylase MltF [Gammaproteobacteria bacterium]
MSSTRPLHSLALLASLFLAACAPPKSQLQQILERGELRIVTRNGPTTYFIDRDGETGIEYEMAWNFARNLGVQLRVIVANNPLEIVDAVLSGRVDLAAAGLTRDSVAGGPLAAGRSYHWVTWQVLYRNGGRLPKNLDEIAPDQLHVAEGTIPIALLEQLRARHPGLSWYIHRGLDSADLMDMVEEGRIAYTVLPSNELAHARQIRPEIRAALNLTPPQPLVWAARKSKDLSLLRAADAFIERIDGNGELAALIDRFYGRVQSFDYADSRQFVDRMTERLPPYRGLFEQTGSEFGLDWRLLAAISYQESHWDVDARSFTGVRGLMMLTNDTARLLGVKDRLDPLQSLRGGAMYLKELDRKMPARIGEPDRTWFVLAAYNVGFGHLEDARVLTQRQGGDPDRWLDVRQRLPLLSHRNWYEQTRHGYARGWEPVRFVDRIEKYYDVLVHATQPAFEEQQIVEAEPATQSLL